MITIGSTTEQSGPPGVYSFHVQTVVAPISMCMITATTMVERLWTVTNIRQKGDHVL